MGEKMARYAQRADEQRQQLEAIQRRNRDWHNANRGLIDAEHARRRNRRLGS
jgi:hypothetical protein